MLDNEKQKLPNSNLKQKMNGLKCLERKACVTLMQSVLSKQQVDGLALEPKKRKRSL